MTPGPITAAAARSKRRVTQSPEDQARTKRRFRRPAGPQTPRRVSGPVSRGASAPGAQSFASDPVPPARAAAAGRAAAAPRPASRPVTAPRTAPAPRPRIAPRPARSRRDQPARVRLIEFLRSIPDHTLLDRLVRGRAWIPMLGVLLAGIVAMQVEVLKMSASIGRSLAYSTQLQSQNEQLRASVAALADDQRIMRLAAGMGMVMPHTGMVGFLSALAPGSLRAATGNIHSPDATTFLYSTPNNGAVVTASNLAAIGNTSVGGVTTLPSATAGQSASGASSAGTSTTQAPALAPSPASGSGTTGSTGGSSTGTSTGSGSNTGTGSTSGGGTNTGTGTGGGSGTGSGTGTANGGGASSGGGAPLTGASGIQPGGGTQTTPSGG